MPDPYCSDRLSDMFLCFLHVWITPTPPPPHVQDLQESEGCQDELALRVQQLKAELVLFKGLMSNVRRRWFFSSFEPIS